MTDIVKLLGNDASSLLEHTCTTIPKDNLYLPGDDFVTRVMI
ncbi:fructose-bisphosphate aldolase, partial [Morganella morganii]